MSIDSEYFGKRVDGWYGLARTSFLRAGTYDETLILIGPKGREDPFISDGRVPFNEGQDLVRRVIEVLHAVAAIHIGQFTATWNTEIAKKTGLNWPGDMPSNLLMVSGHWPAGGISIVRMAHLIPGPVPDLRDVSIPGMTASGWLSDLLPQHERTTS